MDVAGRGQQSEPAYLPKLYRKLIYDVRARTSSFEKARSWAVILVTLSGSIGDKIAATSSSHACPPAP